MKHNARVAMSHTENNNYKTQMSDFASYPECFQPIGVCQLNYLVQILNGKSDSADNGDKDHVLYAI